MKENAVHFASQATIFILIVLISTGCHSDSQGPQNFDDPGFEFEYSRHRAQQRERVMELISPEMGAKHEKDQLPAPPALSGDQEIGPLHHLGPHSPPIEFFVHGGTPYLRIGRTNWTPGSQYRFVGLRCKDEPRSLTGESKREHDVGLARVKDITGSIRRTYDFPVRLLNSHPDVVIEVGREFIGRSVLVEVDTWTYHPQHHCEDAQSGWTKFYVRNDSLSWQIDDKDALQAQPSKHSQ